VTQREKTGSWLSEVLPEYLKCQCPSEVNSDALEVKISKHMTSAGPVRNSIVAQDHQLGALSDFRCHRCTDKLFT
jgi:hypothetical protein